MLVAGFLGAVSRRYRFLLLSSALSGSSDCTAGRDAPTNEHAHFSECARVEPEFGRMSRNVTVGIKCIDVLNEKNDSLGDKKKSE